MPTAPGVLSRIASLEQAQKRPSTRSRSSSPAAGVMAAAATTAAASAAGTNNAATASTSASRRSSVIVRKQQHQQHHHESSSLSLSSLLIKKKPSSAMLRSSANGSGGAGGDTATTTTTNSKGDLQQQQQQQKLNDSLSSASTTLTASQIRKSRLRQQQQVQRSDLGSEVVSNHQNNSSSAVNLVEKRKLIKERRIMQKQRRTGVPSSNQHDDLDEYEDNNYSSNYTTVTGAMNATSTTVNATRTSTIYNANNNTGSGSGGGAFQSTSIAESHGRNTTTTTAAVAANRLSKMQRMQRRKGGVGVVVGGNNNGYDQLQQQQIEAAQPFPSKEATALASSLTNTNHGRNSFTDSTATTNVVQNMASSSSIRRNSHHGSSGGVRHGRDTIPVAVDETSSHRRRQLQQQQHQESHHLSPTSTTGNDTFSDMHNGGPADVSLENVTDDETLTSVRRIVDRNSYGSNCNNDNNGNSNKNNKSSQYQQLQTQLSSRSQQQVSSYDSGASWRGTSGTGRKDMINGTTTNNKQNRTNHGVYGNSRDPLSRNHHLSSGGTGDIWGMEEEKSNKVVAGFGGATTLSSGVGAGGGNTVLRTSSSSDYDTDGDRSNRSKGSRQQMLEGPSHSQATDVNEFFTNSRFGGPSTSKNALNFNKKGNNQNNNHNIQYNGNNHLMNSHQYNNNNSNKKMDDDDRTFDYGDRDDDSNGSTSYTARKRKEAERRARMAAVSSSSMGMGADSSSILINSPGGGIGATDGMPEGGSGGVGPDDVVSPLLNKDDVEHFTKSIDSPAVRLGAGVVGVASLGCLAFGPVGLLMGVAAVGLGFGVMQIPEEERTRIQTKAEKAMHNLQEKVADASETMSSSCLSSYKDSGVADHLPHCLSGTDGGAKDNESTRSEKFCHAGGTIDTGGNITNNIVNNKRGNHHFPPHPSIVPGAGGVGGSAGPGGGVGGQLDQAASALLPHQHNNDRSRGQKKVACLRNARILPIAQIHSLDPSSQPRAWLDVVASANTSNDQKNEAMEEILLLAKDKRRAKIFLDEGILDFIVWTLSRYFEKLDASGKSIDWAHPDITPSERTAANLAAQCCVTLGKAHCAAIHTEGDLLLMSMYERGTVPEERQVAQMLHEIPHHARVTKTNDPTSIDPSKEVFALRQLTLPEAEELARSIKAVADGRL